MPRKHIDLGVVRNFCRFIAASSEMRTVGLGLALSIMAVSPEVSFGNDGTSSAFDNRVCFGQVMDQYDIIQKVGFPNREVYFLGDAAIQSRIRACYKLTGCEAWVYNDENTLGTILSSRNGPIPKVASLYVAVHANRPEVRLVIGAKDPGRQVFARLPNPDGIRLQSDVLQVAGQPFDANLKVYDTCAQLSARSLVNAPTPRDNSRYYEVELAANFRY